MTELARVVGVGARGAGGLDALGVTMAARAQRFEPRSVSLRDGRGQRIGAHLCRSLPEALHGTERLVALAAPALREASRDARRSLSRDLGRQPPPGAVLDGPLPLVVAVSEEGRPDLRELGPDLLSALAHAAEVPIDRERSRMVHGGNAGFALALAAALSILETAPLVLVGAVDSYHHPAVLAWLDAERRLVTFDREGGIVPSEGAAFFVLARPLALGSTCALVHLGVGAEPIDSSLGRAMTDLLRDATAATRDGRVRWILSDVNGERHRQREWGLVSHRGGDLFARSFAHRRVPRELGDTGAATGALMMAIACTSLVTGAAPDREALCALHADASPRAVFVVSAPDHDAGSALFRASVGEAALNVFDLASLLPEVEIAPGAAGPEPGVASAAEVMDVAAALRRHDEGAADLPAPLPGRRERALPAAPPREAPEAEEIRSLARGAMEDVAAFGMLRIPGEDPSWSAVIDAEQRLLDNLDVLVAIARHAAARGLDLLPDLLAYADRFAVLDRGRAFLRTFVLACLPGTDTVRRAVSAIRRDEPRALEAHRTALCLSPSPVVGEAVRALLLRQDPAHVGLALSVLRFRRELRFGDVATMVLHSDVRVATQAARGLGIVAEREAARRLVEDLVGDEEIDERVRVALIESGLRRRSPVCLVTLRARLAEEIERPGSMALRDRDEHVRLLSIAGDRSDAALLVRAADSPAALDALGFHGAIDLVLPLLERLTSLGELPDPARAHPAERACAGALHRITGGDFRAAEPGATRDERTALAAARRALWDSLAGRLDGARKHRFGERYELSHSLRELRDVRSTQGHRRLCEMELAPHVAGIPFEIDHWAAAQRRALDAMSVALGRSSDAAGLWPADRMKRSLT